MSDNNSPTVTNSSTPSSSDRPASNSFWSTIDHIIRPQVSIRSPTVTSSTPTTAAATSSTNFATTDNNFTQAEKFNQRLNDLKSSDSVQNRLKIFDDLIKLSEVSILNESLINNLLESTRDLYLIEKTAIEFRKQAFENLTHIYQKQSEKFESLVNKNHLLIILIANLTNLTSSDSLFLSVFEPMLKNVQTKTGDTLPSACDDIRQRFALFMHMTKNGTCCKNLDPVMANECLKIFIRYSSGLDTKLFYDIIKNLLHNKYFNLFNDTLFLQISKNILDFSYNLLKQTDNLNQLNKNQIIELKSCIDLCEKLSPNLITIESVSYMIIVLCELIALNAQKNSTDTQLMLQIYEILSNLLSGSIGHASLFSFFTQIFPSHGKLQKFRQQQVNGALLHIRQLFDDFKQSKLKSTFLIKEIHLNCLVYLPIALKSCSNEPTQQQQQNLILFENILSLTLDLVQLATHRDLFMCLLTFNSRKFLIEIIEQISSQIAQTDNKKLIQPYAELLNLLDKKDVFNYKTSSSTGAVGGSGGNINSSNSISTSNVPTTSNATDDGNAVVLQKFKDNFHTLVYNFPHISYLNDSCINNCIDYYLGRKLLPTHGKNSIHGIKQLIERYFLIKQNKPIKLEIRKNILELACKKLFDYNRIEYKTFIDDVIQQAILPCIERSISEDNIYYHGFDNDPVNLVQMHSELVEIKSFVVNKLIELSSLCHYEENILKIVGIYQQIIHLEKTNSIDQLSIQNQAISTTNVANKSPANLTSIIVTPSINSQNYLNRIINALIDLFERHHFNSSHCMTRSCAKIYCILTSYLHTYYEAFCNKPSSLSTIAADTLTFQHQQQQQQQPQSQQGHQHRNSISLSMDHNLKYFNYYAQLRRDVFDFLFRIRSDFQNRVQLLNRNDRKKHSDSKYLILALKKNIELIEDCTNKCVLDYGKFLDVIEECLDKESDWNVLIKVLNELPIALQYEMGLIRNSEFVHNVFNYLYKREIITYKNRPETLTRPDYICKFYPLIASLILYHQTLERSSQEIILQNFALGISSSRSRFCLETLTIAITEMHETNAKQCAEILLKLSQFSPSQNMAQPVLELLSTISDLRKLDSTIFGRKEFIAVSATAIKYTDPLKFNPFIILLAHYVICIWFIKCKQDFRKNYASFTCKGLYQEVIVQLDRLNQSKKDSKSPNRQLNDESMKPRSVTVSAISAPSLNLNDDLNKSFQSKTTLTENMKTFYRELVEITLDFMSNNMYFDNTQQLKYNNNGLLVDMYSNASLTGSTNSTLRNNSLIDGTTSSALASANGTSAGFGNRNNYQSRSWICGNKIIQIKTGLFSNICVEEPNSNVSRRQRNSASSSNKKASTITPGSSSHTSTSSKLASSLAINIPNQQINKCNTDTKKPQLVSNQTANDSFASSESSTNNSFNIAKQLGDRDDLILTRKSSLLTATDSDHGKQGDEASLSAKSDQEYFEEAIEGSNSNIIREAQVNLEDEATILPDSNSIDTSTTSKVRPNVASSSRRNNLIKRRYKSGIPLSSNERSDDDLLDEIYIKHLNESAFNKQSKDDSDLSLASSLCCVKNNSSVDEIKQSLETDSQTQANSRTSQRNINTNQRSKTYSDSSDKRTSEPSESSYQSKEMCLPTCWCNNLVEITCRYPTKVVTYVALIDGNNCTSHELNLSLIELQKQQQQTLKTLLKSSEKKVSDLISDTDNSQTIERNPSEPTIITPSMIANAVELRRNLSLSRISESSVSQPELSSANSNNSLESTNKDDEPLALQQVIKPNQLNLAKTAVLNQTAAMHNTSSNLNKSFYENDLIYQRPALMRKSSFDSSAPIPTTNIISAAAARIPYHDLSASVSMSTARRQIQSPSNEPNSSSPNNSSLAQSTFNSANTSINLSSKQAITPAVVPTSIDPAQVFLHLFQQTTQPYSTTNNSSQSNDKDQQPMMIPENPASQRSMNILDYLPCYLIHKIGIVYIGRNQANDEKAILSNASGSQRYKSFINGLGQLMRLKDLDTNRYYSGGLETDGSAGEFTLIWFDGIIQVVFHVATMMPLREDNCNSKKKHIGNDATLIVYNESGEEYQFNMIKGEVNCVCIEIEPLTTSNINLIRVKTTSELAQSSWIIHQDQKFVSDQNLSIVTRKMALHADIASRCYRFQKDNNGNNPYGGKWYERLKQINRIRKSCKEFYAKQQPVKSGSNTANTTASSSTTTATPANSANSSTSASSTQINTNSTDVPFDFTEYI